MNRQKMLVIALLVMLSTLFIGLVPASANTPVPANPADRVVITCQTTRLDIYGVTDASTGFYLTSFTYTELLLGTVTRNTDNGQVRAGFNGENDFFVQWIGGPYFATGTGDFAKRFSCPSAFFAVPVSGTGTGTPGNAGTPVGTGGPTTTTQVTIEQTATVDGVVTASQTVTVEQSTADSHVCGNRLYTIRTGDTLFRIARRFGTTVSALAACNGIHDPSLIYIGDVIRVP